LLRGVTPRRFDDEMTSLRVNDEMNGRPVIARSAVIDGQRLRSCAARRVIKNHSCSRLMDKRQRPF
jgi:hypothetical protein